MEMILLLVAAILVSGPAVWMTFAVADNWLHPRLNEEAVAMVMRFDMMAVEYPDDFKLLAHRRIEDPEKIRRAFQGIRLAETLAAIAMSVSALLLAGAAFGYFDTVTAVTIAILSMAIFVSVWAGFIIGGNFFAYWYCHQWAQSNHFMLLYWGFFVLLALLLISITLFR